MISIRFQTKFDLGGQERDLNAFPEELFLLSNPPLLVLVQKLTHRRARGHLAVLEEERPLVQKNDASAVVVHHLEDCRGIALCRDALEGDKAVVVHALVALEPFVQLDALVVVRVAPRPAAIDLGECVELKKAKQDVRQLSEISLLSEQTTPLVTMLA